MIITNVAESNQVDTVIVVLKISQILQPVSGENYEIRKPVLVVILVFNV